MLQYTRDVTRVQDMNFVEKCAEYVPHMEQPGTPVIDHQRWPLLKMGSYHFKLGNEKAWIKSVYVYHKMVFQDRQGNVVDDDILIMS